MTEHDPGGNREPVDPPQNILDATLQRVNGVIKDIYPTLPVLTTGDITVVSDLEFTRAQDQRQASAIHPVFLRILQNAARRSGKRLSLSDGNLEAFSSYSRNMLYLREKIVKHPRPESGMFDLGIQLVEHSIILGTQPIIYDGKQTRQFIPRLINNIQNEGGITQFVTDAEKREMVRLANQKNTHILVRGSGMRIIEDGRTLGPLFDANTEIAITNYLALPVRVALCKQLIADGIIPIVRSQAFMQRTQNASLVGSLDPFSNALLEQDILHQLASIGIRGRAQIIDSYLRGEIPARRYELDRK